MVRVFPFLVRLIIIVMISLLWEATGRLPVEQRRYSKPVSAVATFTHLPIHTTVFAYLAWHVCWTNIPPLPLHSEFPLQQVLHIMSPEASAMFTLRLKSEQMELVFQTGHAEIY